MKIYRSHLWSMCAGYIAAFAEIVSTLLGVDATDVAYLHS